MGGADERVRKNLAVAGGEALAAQLIASAALRAALMVLPNPLEVLRGISAFIDDTLNMSGPAKGEGSRPIRATVIQVTVR
jgi:hypothetical protein